MNCPPRKTLEEQIDPTRSALIVIDPQNDFCSERGGCATQAHADVFRVQAAVPRLNAFVEAARGSGVTVVYVREILDDAHMMPAHKVLHGEGDDIWIIREGTWGAEWYEALTPPQPGEKIVRKWLYDAFADTDLDLYLRSHGIDTILMTGFITNVCVETTARHGFINGYNVVLVKDCTDTYTQLEYDAALYNIATYFGKVTSSEEIAGIWASGYKNEPAVGA